MTEQHHHLPDVIGAISDQVVMNKQGFIDPKTLANALHTDVKWLAFITGISVSELTHTDQASSQDIQCRLQELLNIINQVTIWSGNVQSAYAWYCSEPLPSFGDRSAMDLVKEGKANAVLEFIGRLGQGGYA